MSRTLVIIIVGLALAVVFLLAGLLVRPLGVKRAAEDFLLVWFALAAGNLAIGVFEAGYSFAEELPIFLLIFAVPGVPGFAVWLLARNRATPN
ncbi:hypothetical protein [Amycolatopsis cihanbeyliensis]|uniref:Uncharacterized protein n=1 Tax=Amycolatopsis cihanbeyliensis TaxID=1128664 RepID=A0A542DQA4_AMYCI|nr:hypothetical protein [Amycolatopsis cihanbeyliensis]TQJ05290.1 hypothetical protein FB471_5118 [Amycolatopsis cihanbeyliensis]